MEQSVLGLPLEDALALLAQAGADAPTIEYTRAPRGEAQSGTLRVVRQQQGALLVARFPDQVGDQP